jgi:PRTRC genetic system protein C
MAIQIEESPKRVFIVTDSDGNEIPITDPNPQLSPREVVKHLSGLYPNVLNSTIKGPEVQKDGSFKFTITSAAGSFG